MHCSLHPLMIIFFFFNDTATTEIYTLSLHDALPISPRTYLGPSIYRNREWGSAAPLKLRPEETRSEEHTSELQSHLNLVCRLLLEKKKKYYRPKRSNNTTSFVYVARQASGANRMRDR